LGILGIMTTELNLSAAFSSDSVNSLGPKRKRCSEELPKILGEQLAVTADQMAELLRRGMTVRELLEYLEARSGEVL
jgi:hypothetical protein